MKHFYAIVHNSFSLNDSDEKIKDWGTATVYRFATKRERDSYCESESYHLRIGAKRAKYIGFTDYDTCYPLQ